MTYLLDTDVISEWVKPRPHPQVVAWFADVEEDVVFLSVVSFAEIRRGVDLLPDGRRRERLAIWLTEELPARFEGRILDIDHPVADAWGTITARAQKAGRTMGSMDAFVAATAGVHGLTLVTRNVKDYQGLGLALCDPSAS